VSVLRSLNTVIAVSFSPVGDVIAPRLPPWNPIGWLFCVIRLLVTEYAIATLLAEPGSGLERVMNLGENRIEMRIPRSAWFPRDLCFPHS
jgi:hypothetical protein